MNNRIPLFFFSFLAAVAIGEAAAEGNVSTFFFGEVPKDAKVTYGNALVLRSIGGLISWEEKPIRTQDEVAYISKLLKTLKKDTIVVIFDRQTKIGDAVVVLGRLRSTGAKQVSFQLER